VWTVEKKLTDGPEDPHDQNENPDGKMQRWEPNQWAKARPRNGYEGSEIIIMQGKKSQLTPDHHERTKRRCERWAAPHLKGEGKTVKKKGTNFKKREEQKTAPTETRGYVHERRLQCGGKKRLGHK